MSHPERPDRGHGSPYDRGWSDAYYRRGWEKPHKWLDGAAWLRVDLTDPAEIAEYHLGFDECDDRKEWR